MPSIAPSHTEKKKGQVNNTNFMSYKALKYSVPDPNPDPPDPCVFGLPDPDPALDTDPSIIMQK